MAKGDDMGGGQSYTKDIPRRGSGKNLLKEIADLSSGLEASGGAIASGEEFCAREHRVDFRLTNGRTPVAGEAVHLIAGSPLVLSDSLGALGVIESDSAKALNNCLDADWAMTGTVAAFDLVTDRGVATLAGER
jgi:hypothetical protein